MIIMTEEKAWVCVVVAIGITIVLSCVTCCINSYCVAHDQEVTNRILGTNGVDFKRTDLKRRE